jgi:hypothetical protein
MMKKLNFLNSSRINKRVVRLATLALFSGIILINFQNCAPAQMCSSSKDAASCKEQSGSSNQASTGSGNKNPTNNNGSSGNNSGGFGSTNGSVNNGGSGSGGGSGTVVIGGGGTGGGSGGGGSGGGGSSGGGGTGSTALYIFKQPASVTVNEFATLQLDVQASGGKPPYTYQWYKDNGLLAQNFYILSLDASSWKVEGAYYVIVKDSAGASVQSSIARVGVAEPAVGCNAGTYFTLTSATYDWNDLIGGFIDGPRGKYLLPRGFPGSEVFNSMPTSYSGVSNYNFGAVAYLGKAALSCRTTVPRIHTPQQNPQGSGEYGTTYDDTANYKYEGSINFECRNQKLKFISNTCNWRYIPPPPDYGGGG